MSESAGDERRSRREMPSVAALKQRLQSLKAPIDSEIRSYPTPIAGCDAQFNYLLEERAKLARELVQLEKLSRKDAAARETAIAKFIQSSEYLTPR